MWTSHVEPLHEVAGFQFRIELRGSVARYSDVIAAWQTDATFRAFFNDMLVSVPFTAFRWETPAVTIATQTQPFEFVSLDAPYLARKPDPTAFSEHFEKTSASVVAFPNLKGDAVMIVPTPQADDSAYGHLAAFVRGAPAAQRDELWRTVGEEMAKRLSTKPVWLSTAGAGVSWLHVRLDDRPKYYGYTPYAKRGQ